MKIGERFMVTEEPRLRHQIRHHVARTDRLGFKMDKVFTPEGRRGVCRILDEELFDPCRPVGGWHPGEGEIAIRLEMPARFLERCTALLVDQPAGRIAPGTFGIVTDGLRSASICSAQPEPNRRRRLFMRAVTATSSSAVELSRSGPISMVRCRLPSLLRTMPGAIRQAHLRWSASEAGRARYSRRFSMRNRPSGGCAG